MILLKMNLVAYTGDSKEKINCLTEKVKVEQQTFPQGDLRDVDYVKRIISQMHLLDQELRAVFAQDFDNPEIQCLIAQMDEFHLTKMKQILLQYGWITISKFGQDADRQAWLLVQHADHDPLFQAGCLYILSCLIDKGETNKKNYAYLYDRVALKFQSLGMKQRYGTQLSLGNKEFELLPYEGSIEEINRKRSEVGLPPLEEYLKMIKQTYQH